MNDGFGLKKTPSISVCDLGWITINGWLKKIHDTFKWVWVNTYRYIFSGLFTSINPSYDLGFTRGTRVLTHPQITNGRNPQEDSVTLRGTVPQCVASQCLYNLPWGERYVHNCSAVATWLGILGEIWWNGNSISEWEDGNQQDMYVLYTTNIYNQTNGFNLWGYNWTFDSKWIIWYLGLSENWGICPQAICIWIGELWWTMVYSTLFTRNS